MNVVKIFDWQLNMCNIFDKIIDKESEYYKLKEFETRIKHFLYFDIILGNPSSLEYQNLLENLLKKVINKLPVEMESIVNSKNGT